MRRTWKASLALMALVLLMQSDTSAGPEGCTNSPSLTPFAFETITVSTTALGFTATSYAPAGVKAADYAVLSIATAALRYRADGLAPSATVGHVLPIDGAATVCGTSTIRKILLIRKDATDAVVSVTYYREGDQ